ncbi:MAG TPA: DUF503 domain-containing protein [Sporosarcina sp.]|nr:DUF503 domain-containing protein [Sporosarcina sp.]
MIVYAECTFFIPMAASLKDKRSVVKRMIDRTRNQFNLSIAEIDHQDLWQRTTLALVVVNRSQQVAEREIARAIQLLESNPEWEMTDYNIEQY